MLLLAINILAVVTQPFIESSFNYDKQDKWGKISFYCNGIQQSPINLPPSAPNLVSLKSITIYENPATYAIKNNGHTAMLNIKSGRVILDGASSQKLQHYIDQVHFHWGISEEEGSEHRLNGLAFPLEMHVVGYNIDYANVSEAATQRDGLVVLALMFTISEKDNPYLKPVIDGLREIVHHNQEKGVEKFILTDLIGLRIKDYFRYYGSLTTPNCYETVEWSISTKYLNISKNQLRAFQSLKNPEGKFIAPNFRKIQDTNARKIFHRHALWQ